MANNISSAFTPSGNSRVLSTTATSSNITMVTTGTNAFMLDNVSGNVVFVNIGSGGVNHPLSGNTGNGVVIQATSSKILFYPALGTSENANVLISGITAAGIANVYITAGTITN
jgi:hypothetical protein